MIVVLAAAIIAPFFVAKLIPGVHVLGKGVEWLLGVGVIAVIFGIISAIVAAVAIVYDYIVNG